MMDEKLQNEREIPYTQHITNVISGQIQAQGSIQFGIGNINQYGEETTYKTRTKWKKDRLEQIYNNFIEDLHKRAMEMCGEVDHFRRGKIQIAPLQLCTHSRYIDKMEQLGHFHHRNNTAAYHENNSGNISYTELFVEAQRFTRNNSVLCSTREAKRRCSTIHGNVVFITGEAGVGKSTLSKRLVEEMLDKTNSLYGAKIVFFMKFRDVNYKEKTNLLHFLTTGCNFIRQNYTGKKQSKILEELQKREEDICIVMDGLDEAIINCASYLPVCDLHSHVTPETFIKNLIDGNIFPQSKLIITTRPRQLTRLSGEYFSYFIVNILGLNKAGRENICRDVCGGDYAQEQKILGFINNHPDLQRYCFVPINCILIMRSFKETEAGEWNTIFSLTAIFVTALNRWFLKQLKDTFQIKKLAELAYEGFIANKYHFEEWDLKKVGISFPNLTTFLTNTFKFQLLDGSLVTSYFVHLTWQEFFVAIKLRLYMNPEEFRNILSRLASKKYDVVITFLFGLCNDRTLAKLVGHITTEQVNELNSSADRFECKEMLKQLAAEKLAQSRSKFENRVYNADRVYSDVLPTLGWVYECNEDAFSKHAAECLMDKIDTDEYSKFYPGDIPHLNHVLRARQSTLTLSLDFLEFVGNCQAQFYTELSITLKRNHNIQIESISFFGNRWMHDPHHTWLKCIDRVRRIQFINCAINDEEMRALAQKIKGRQKRMESLTIWGLGSYFFGNDGACALPGCLHKINKLTLYLYFCNFATSIKNKLKEQGREVGCDVCIIELNENDSRNHDSF